MTRRINQKNPADCAVCALAMFLEVDYDQLMDDLPYLVDKVKTIAGGGLNKDEMIMVASLYKRRPIILIQNYYDHEGSRTKELFKMLAGIPAVMSAISLNVPHVGHAVYWDGKKIHDPSNKNKYRKSTIKPFEIMY